MEILDKIKKSNEWNNRHIVGNELINFQKLSGKTKHVQKKSLDQGLL